MRLRKARFPIGTGQGVQVIEREVPYLEPQENEEIAGLLRHICNVLKEQGRALERIEFHLADIYDRLRQAGMMPEGPEALAALNELAERVEKQS